MKIKHPKEHDEIVQWIFNNPETILKKLEFKEPFEKLVKIIQLDIPKGKTIIGNFDIQLRFKESENNENDLNNDDDYSPKQYAINIIVNVKMESATEQLRDLKKFTRQHSENTKGNHIIQKYVIVSKNDDFKTFFTDNKFIFYKFD